jgi:ribosome-associated protein
MIRTRSKGDPAATRAFAVDLARECVLDKCQDVTVLDVRGLSQVCDYVVIASGTSDRQMKSVAQSLEDLGKGRGQPPFRSDRDTGTTWIVVDFVDVVVHLFEPGQRQYYDLESLWADAKPVEVPAIAGTRA